MDDQPPPSYAEVASSSNNNNNHSRTLFKDEKNEMTSRPNMPRQRSRGQIARRNSITRGGDGRAERRKNRKKGMDSDQATSTKAKLATASSRGGKQQQQSRSTERPWLGGLYFTDIIFIAFTYSVNLLRTLGLAELADIIFKGLMYALTKLPFELYRRWSLSIPPHEATLHSRHRAAAKIRKRRRRRQGDKRQINYSTETSSDSDPYDYLSEQPNIFASSKENNPEPEVIDQLSPFHHLVILLSRFACGNFPHLLPRVLFAEETIGPFVYWRTGGGSNAMVQEFTDLTERKIPLLRNDRKSNNTQTSSKQNEDEKSFRAYLLSKDARLPIEVQRANLASRRATTLLYLHGGGFSLGSVAFYAEALLRLRAKIALLESDGPIDAENPAAEARCVAVEYDLSPAARFPQPLLQCLRCYAHLIEVEKIHPDSICLSGDSAGGNLAMAMLLCLDGQMRDEPLLAERDWSTLPMPGKAVLISPWVDLRPTRAHAFSHLRSKRNNSNDLQAENISTSDSENAANVWTEAVAKYDWDFVAAETLLHFAQVYSGVLPLPRRVYGPLGWIAHVCGVLSIEYDSEEESETSKKGFMNPFRALSALSRPSRKLARATHEALNDPLLPRLLGLNMIGTGVQSQSDTVSRYDSITAGFEPLFTPGDRQTDVVNDKSHLYEAIDGPLSSSGADKIGIDQNATRSRLHARQLLDTHPLLSPAIGDWSKIKLKHGCLVTWGERERMAEDIECWVDSLVNQTQQFNFPPSTDTPAPDGQQAQNFNQSAVNDESDEDWVYTAVEKGPGGVHAWPFVSMYLAGSEGERERGLDLMARFVARTRLDVGQHDSKVEEERGRGDKNVSNLGQPFSLPDLDPPHAAPESADEISDSDSVGSMPSDVDLHGLVEEDDGEEEDERIVNIADAVRRAQELGYTDEKVFNNNDDGDGTIRSEDSNVQITPKVSARMIKTSSAPSSSSSSSTSSQRPPFRQLPSAPIEVERGRSRSPRKVVLQTPSAQRTVDSSHFVSNVHLHHPQTIIGQNAQLINPTNQPSPSKTPAPSIWWTGASVGTRSTRSTDEDDSRSQSRSPEQELRNSTNNLEQEQQLADLSKEVSVDTDNDEDEDDEDPRRSQLDDIQEVSSEEAMSPTQSNSPSPPRQTANAELSVNTDPILYGNNLARWAIRRPEPEGLSDIAEEGSVLSASITSNGGGEGSRSRSLSPVGQWQNAATVENHFSGPSLTEAATQFMMQQQDQTQSQPSTHQWRYLRDEIGMRSRTADDDEEEEEEEDEGSRAFSPPAKPQPGRSLPVVSTTTGNAAPQISEENEEESQSEDPTTPGPSGAVGIQRKKPKGDVWW
ncbi:hypothetical protein L7F22_053964 [Adiantum nelumboides]|nr:hypothetical protein [Adiantum nelumboides]